MIGSIGPSIRWDILNYGRLVNNVRVQDARFEAAAYAYQDQVLTAGREVEDALIAFLLTQKQTRHLAASVEAANRTVVITNEQYGQGAVDFTPVFLFESTLTTQQDQYAAAQGDTALALIAVYRALGGGWQIRLGEGLAEAAAPLPMPALQEMRLDVPVQNDIQFQSFEFDAAFAAPTGGENSPAATASLIPVAPPTTDGFPGRQL
jgi:hypothetical protein